MNGFHFVLHKKFVTSQWIKWVEGEKRMYSHAIFCVWLRAMSMVEWGIHLMQEGQKSNSWMPRKERMVYNFFQGRDSVNASWSWKMKIIVTEKLFFVNAIISSNQRMHMLLYFLQAVSGLKMKLRKIEGYLMGLGEVHVIIFFFFLHLKPLLCHTSGLIYARIEGFLIFTFLHHVSCCLGVLFSSCPP